MQLFRTIHFVKVIFEYSAGIEADSLRYFLVPSCCVVRGKSAADE